MVDFLHRIYNPVTWLASVANTLGTLVIFILVVTMNADVIARGFFHAPLRGVVEVVIFSLVLIVFLQLPDVIRRDRLTRSDGFLLYMDQTAPRMADVARRLIDCAACIFMILIAWTIWPEFLESVESCEFGNIHALGEASGGGLISGLQIAFGRCEYFGTPGIFTAPWWPIKLTIAMSVTLCAIILAYKTAAGSEEERAATKGNTPE